MKNWKILDPIFQRMFAFCFLLVLFLLYSNNTLHVMFYTYICYWNTFRYKYIIKITFHVVKQSHVQVTSKDICLLFIVLFLCLFLFCLNFLLFYEALLLLHCLIDLVYRYIWKLPLIHTFWRDIILIASYISDLLNVCIAFILAGIQREFLCYTKLCNCVAKCVTLAILAKTPRNIGKYFKSPFAKSNLLKNSFKSFTNFSLVCFLSFFNWNSLQARLNSHCEAWNYKKKKYKKAIA